MKTLCESKFLAGAFAAVFTLLSPMAYGQEASRTWVSGVGDDADSGSRTSPCKTFAGVISKTAPGGEINCLDPGNFGAVTITKSMTIDGQGTMGSILATKTTGVIINAGVNGVVTLRNLSINGNSTGLDGIRILAAAEVNIENCVIFEFSKQGLDIGPAAACRVNIKNCIVRGCAGGAVYAHPSDGGTVVTVTDSHLLHSQFGFRADDRVTATFTNSVLSGHTNHGVIVVAPTEASRVNVNNCVISDNGITGLVGWGAFATIVISQNTISQNTMGLNTLDGASIISFGTNRNNGNTVDGVPTSFISLQ